jgi:uncharacterized DUF497 family protein
MKTNLFMENYTGGDPDSELAYFSKDLSGPEDEDVFVDCFVWRRDKSNQNLIDTEHGKGFSFYYARHGFEDEDCLNIFNIENPDDIVKTLGIIYKKKVIVITSIDEDDKIRIISAWEDDDTYLTERYWKNKETHAKKKKNHRQTEITTFKRYGARFTSEMDKDEKDEIVNIIKKRLEGI